ncbi:MAG: type III pantothenate kinase [Gammaproteobacteria bacterium]
MRLLVDVGNSRLKWAFCAPGERIAPNETPLGTPDELLPLLQSAIVPDEIRLSNVAGADVGSRVAGQLERKFGLKPIIAASARQGAGVTNGYLQPLQLGTDRCLAICAAYDRYQSAVWVVDAGTATTIDHVTRAGEHRGGLILPGIGLMQSVLFHKTGDLARLAGIDLPQGTVPGPLLPPAVAPMDGLAMLPAGLGRDTATAIRAGALQATATTILHHLQEGDEVIAGVDAARLVLTGGMGATLQAMLSHIWSSSRRREDRDLSLEYRPQLVLEGLALDPPCFVTAP